MTTVLPPVAALELTYRCNHACRFCSCPWFAGMIKPSAEMSVDEWKRLIDEFAANGVRQFSFTGGEALMKEGCLDLVDFASKRALISLGVFSPQIKSRKSPFVTPKQCFFD